MTLRLNPDIYPEYQTLVDSLFALNMAAAPKYYTIRVYGLGLAYLDLGHINQVSGTITDISAWVLHLYSEAVPPVPWN